MMDLYDHLYAALLIEDIRQRHHANGVLDPEKDKPICLLPNEKERFALSSFAVEAARSHRKETGRIFNG